MLNKDKKVEAKPYYLDSDKIFHFHVDCIANTGNGKFITRHDSINYRLCEICSSRLSIETHEKRLEIEQNMGKWIAEAAVKATALGISSEEKENVMNMVTLQIYMMYGLYVVMDESNKIKDESQHE